MGLLDRPVKPDDDAADVLMQTVSMAPGLSYPPKAFAEHDESE
jgi:hypothetical protein